MPHNEKQLLVWLDLEMSGLNPAVEKILEIAVLITTDNLEMVAQGPHIIIHQEQSVLDSMDDWNKKQHGQSGLIDRVKQSTITTACAEEQILAFIKQYAQEKKAYLSGNSVWVDRLFLHTQMPRLDSYLHYRIIDVSSIKQLVSFWYPQSPLLPYSKKNAHRADLDIAESVAELAFYKKHFFIAF